MNVQSLHHISLIASDAQRTVDFSTRTLVDAVRELLRGVDNG